jgi:flagellar assembly protein FliH
LSGQKYPIAVNVGRSQSGQAATVEYGPEEEAADKMQKAYEAGYAAGQAAAKAELESMVAAKADGLTSMVDDVATQRIGLVADSERDVVRLACEVAKRIIGRIADTDEEAIVRVVKVALSRLAENQKVTLRVNPADMEALKQHKSDWLQATRGGSAVEIKEDERIRRGGCLIEGSSGNIEGEIDRQIEVIERALVEAVG